MVITLIAAEVVIVTGYALTMNYLQGANNQPTTVVYSYPPTPA